MSYSTVFVIQLIRSPSLMGCWVCTDSHLLHVSTAFYQYPPPNLQQALLIHTEFEVQL